MVGYYLGQKLLPLNSIIEVIYVLVYSCTLLLVLNTLASHKQDRLSEWILISLVRLFVTISKWKNSNHVQKVN